jgi:hypothetical protein
MTDALGTLYRVRSHAQKASAAAPAGSAVQLLADNILAEVLPFTSPTGGQVRAANTMHLYASTYCQHGLHSDCRQNCKICESPCLCPHHNR